MYTAFEPSKPGGLGLFGKKKKLPTKDEAKKTVQSIYQEFLLRDPWNPYDPGAEGFVNCLVEGWCDTDFIRQGVISSKEYADKELKRAQAVYGAGGTATASLPSSAAAGAMPGSPFGGILSMTIGGIPVTYLAGGVLLLSLLRGRR